MLIFWKNRRAENVLFLREYPRRDARRCMTPEMSRTQLRNPKTPASFICGPFPHTRPLEASPWDSGRWGPLSVFSRFPRQRAHAPRGTCLPHSLLLSSCTGPWSNKIRVPIFGAGAINLELPKHGCADASREAGIPVVCSLRRTPARGRSAHKGALGVLGVTAHSFPAGELREQTA